MFSLSQRYEEQFQKDKVVYQEKLAEYKANKESSDEEAAPPKPKYIIFVKI